MGQQCGPSLGNSYEELKRQREEEINGLKEALKVCERTYIFVVQVRSILEDILYLVYALLRSEKYFLQVIQHS